MEIIISHGNQKPSYGQTLIERLTEPKLALDMRQLEN